MNDSLHSSVVISIVRMSLADKNLSDGQTQLLLQMGEGSWGPCDPESRESIPELIAKWHGVMLDKAGYNRFVLRRSATRPKSAVMPKKRASRTQVASRTLKGAAPYA
jgi:hypothetical protein